MQHTHAFVLHRHYISSTSALVLTLALALALTLTIAFALTSVHDKS